MAEENVLLDLPRYQPAGFWIRAGAFVLDFAIVFTLAFPVGLLFGIFEAISVAFVGEQQLPTFSLILGLLRGGISLLTAFFYFGYCFRTRGTTWGKQILGLKVIKLPLGNHAGYREVFTREILGRAVSSVLFFTGYLFVIFRADKRALHDLIGETWVLKKVR